MKRLLALSLAAGLAFAQPAAAASRSTVPELLQTWLEIQEDPTQWRTAWLTYEASNSHLLDQAFYGLYTPEKKAELLSAFSQGQLNEWPTQMHELGQLYQNWPSDFDAVKDELSRDFGHAPGIQVLVLYAAAPQAVTYSAIDGKPTLSLNARMLLPYSTERQRAHLARWLYPFVAGDRPVNPAGRSVSALLQAEGLASLAADRAAPQASIEEVLQIPAEELGRYRAGEAGFARELLLALDSKAPAQAERFFGAEPPDGWPEHTGRYVALLAARELVKGLSPKAIAAMDERAFAARVRPVLKKLATPSP